MTNDNYLTPLPPEMKGEISASEALRVEFKVSYAEKDEIKATIIAFANAVGGRIYVGVKETSGKAGIRQGTIVGLTSPGISQASSYVRDWCASFRPPVDASLTSYEEDGKRVDVIEAKESTQKPVGSSRGLYKIRSSDGNIGIDPAVLREMIVGYGSYKSALVRECRDNLKLLRRIPSQVATSETALNELRYSTTDAILTNGTLSSLFEIGRLVEVRALCVQINKLLDFAISAGGVAYETKVFHDKLLELCPVLENATAQLLSKLK